MSGDVEKEAAELSATYEQMSSQFAETGLDLAFVRENSTNYDITQERCSPLPYTALPKPLSERAVRLFVLPLEEAPDLVAVAGQICHSIAAILPRVFHFLRPDPDDPRPVSMSMEGSDAIKALPKHLPPGPSDAEVERERSMMAELVRTSPPLTGLEVHSVVFAPSGTLLLVYIDRRPDMVSLRRHLRSCAPGAPAKQTSIIHTTLLRVLTPAQLHPSKLTVIKDSCERWTRKLRGTQFSITQAWYIIERVFSAIEGERTVWKFGGDRGGQPGS